MTSKKPNESVPVPIPEMKIPIIQQRLQTEKIISEIKSKKKWELYQRDKIENDLKEKAQLFPLAEGAIETRLKAAENGKPFLQTSFPHRSEPDATTYYGYGIAPPGLNRDSELQIARGAFDGNFVKSRYATQERSKFGKLTSEKRWMDYSGAIIFGKPHLDPLANDFRRFRSTPRALRTKNYDDESSDEESPRSTTSKASISSNVSKTLKTSKSFQQRSSSRQSTYSSRSNLNETVSQFNSSLANTHTEYQPRTSARGPFTNKYTDFTFSFSPLTRRPMKETKNNTRQDIQEKQDRNESSRSKSSTINHNTKEFQEDQQQAFSQSSQEFLLGSSIKVGGRWKVAKASSRPQSAKETTSPTNKKNERPQSELSARSNASQSSKRLEKLLSYRNNRLSKKTSL